MPMSKDFEQRLHPILRDVAAHFATPFHIYDERGILEQGERLKRAFAGVKGFQEFYAVKALPNPEILKLMHAMGFGFDCSSIPELVLARKAGATPERIMFTSNNTEQHEFECALEEGGSIINLDDVSLIPKLALRGSFPTLICFRYNPGPRKVGGSIIGNPVEAKYGVTHEQIVEAYRKAKELGAKRFGLHTMVCSNTKEHPYMVDTVRLLLEVATTLRKELGIDLEFINMGGGIGIPYKLDDPVFDIEALATECARLLEGFHITHASRPAIVMESGRWMTGPHGVFVTTVINRKEIYETHVGVDGGMTGLMRHGMYGAYHHSTVLGGEGRETEVVNVVGAICENCDRLATQITLPKTKEGDLIITHDTGAHGLAMGFNYNGRLRPKELMFRTDGTVELIRREEEMADLFATLTFPSKQWKKN